LVHNHVLRLRESAFFPEIEGKLNKGEGRITTIET